MTKFNNIEEYLENKKQMLIKKYGMELPATITGEVEYWEKEECRKFLWIKGTRKVRYTEKFKISFHAPVGLDGEEDINWTDGIIYTDCPISIERISGFSGTWRKIYIEPSTSLFFAKALAEFLNNLEKYYEEQIKEEEERKRKAEEGEIKRKETEKKFLSMLK